MVRLTSGVRRSVSVVGLLCLLAGSCVSRPPSPPANWLSVRNGHWRQVDWIIYRGDGGLGNSCYALHVAPRPTGYVVEGEPSRGADPGTCLHSQRRLLEMLDLEWQDVRNGTYVVYAGVTPKNVGVVSFVFQDGRHERVWADANGVFIWFGARGSVLRSARAGNQSCDYKLNRSGQLLTVACN